MNLGIDIGGTTINAGLVEKDQVVRKLCRPSFADNATLVQTIDYLKSIIDEIITPEVEEIGIGVPSAVDTVEGIVYDAANVPCWKEVHLKEAFEKRYSRTVKLNNDSNCFALGAYGLEVKSKPQICLGITIGTGIGVGVLYNGKIISGANTGVGELSSSQYLEGCYEDYCSRKFFKSKGYLVSKEAYDAAKAGDQRALEVFSEFAGHLGKFISLVMYAYDPEIIILGGGIARSHDMFMDGMYKVLQKEYAYKTALSKLSIITALDDDYAIVGAANL